LVGIHDIARLYVILVAHRIRIAQLEAGRGEVHLAPDDLAVRTLHRHVVADEGLETLVASPGAKVGADERGEEYEADRGQQGDIENFRKPLKHRSVQELWLELITQHFRARSN